MSLTAMPSAAPGRKILAVGAVGSFSLLLADLLIWALDTYVFEPDVPDSIPHPVAAFVLGAMPMAAAVLAGYLTSRGADEIGPPQRPGQHVRRVDEAGAARLPSPRDTAVVLALLFLGAVVALMAVGTARSW